MIKSPDQCPKRVILVTHTVFHYRQKFHELVSEILFDHGIEYRVLYGRPDNQEAKKADTVTIGCGTLIKNTYLHFRANRNPLIWQPVFREAADADLTIIIQENRLIVNYLLQAMRRLLRGKLALFGHGRNFQSRNPSGLAEQWKRYWSLKADWWFGYTDETRRHIESLGFPGNRITVFNNSIDTSELKDLAAQVTPERLAERRAELGLAGKHVAIFVGGLYPDKRPDFLIKAADLIRASLPDFELLVVGGGVALSTLQAAAADRPWLKTLGPRFGSDKVELMLLSQIFLMPGLVGLAVLDAGTIGLPIITTAFPWHSPEIAYLQPGVNGLKVEPWEDVNAYAAAVVALFNDPHRLSQMVTAGQQLAETYSVNAMAQRFAAGVRAALTAPKQ